MIIIRYFLFFPGDSSAIHARQPLTMDDLVCECCFKACFPGDFNRYCHLAK